MICSGMQTVVFRRLSGPDLPLANLAISLLRERKPAILNLTHDTFKIATENLVVDDVFEKFSESEFRYVERLGARHQLYIIGGGHCALALSELMSKMDFSIHIFDDRPELNTIEKNEFADEIEIIESYEKIADHIVSGPNAYIVVMTLGYAYDKIVIQKLIDREFKYFGVLGSKAKMATLIKELKTEGYPEEVLRRIHTPIGVPINSRTPEEIAVSIAAEIISVKNG
jgi:xanthine dehydrogenase accessory factor